MKHVLTFSEFEMLCQTSKTFRATLWNQMKQPVDIVQIVRDVCDGIMDNKIGCIKRVRETFNFEFLSNNDISIEDLAAFAGCVAKVDHHGLNLVTVKKIVENCIDFPRY